MQLDQIKETFHEVMITLFSAPNNTKYSRSKKKHAIPKFIDGMYEKDLCCMIDTVVKLVNVSWQA